MSWPGRVCCGWFNHPQIAEPFAWQLADRVIALALSTGDHPPPTGQGALARWLYIAALRDTPPHYIDPTTAAAALGALAASAAGTTRTLQAATALLDNPAQAQSVRRGALALLVDSRQPDAFAAIERASGDDNHELRSDALEALNHQAPERASIALGRAAIDQSATSELRIDDRTAGPAPGAGGQPDTIQCLADTTLPLYARLQSVAALGPPGRWTGAPTSDRRRHFTTPGIRAAATGS